MAEVTSFPDVRRAQRAEALAEYRRLVVGLAEGKPFDKALADLVDPILARLGITDDDVDADKKLFVERQSLLAEIADFERKIPEIKKECDALTKEIASINDILLRGGGRLDRAIKDRKVVGSAHQKAAKKQKRVDAIERSCPRMFG